MTPNPNIAPNATNGICMQAAELPAEDAALLEDSQDGAGQGDPVMQDNSDSADGE